MGVAAQQARAKMAEEASGSRDSRDRLEDGHPAAVSGTAVNGARQPRVPNTTNISFDRVEAESLLIALDLAGVAVSTGSACSSGTLEPSHVLKAMGFPPHRTQNSIRFSLGAANTDRGRRSRDCGAAGDRRKTAQPDADTGSRVTAWTGVRRP